MRFDGAGVGETGQVGTSREASVTGGATNQP